MRVTFAHGLWSGVNSGKAAWMREQGWDVVAVDMRKYGWDQAHQTQALLDVIDEEGPFDLLIGSSFGGLATANAAAQRPELDLRLVLLAPAFGYGDLISATLGSEAMAAWKTTNMHSFTPPGWDEPVVLPWSFADISSNMGWPELLHPTAILHGTQDDVVPIAHSERAVANHPHVTLHPVNDGHRLHDSLEHLHSLAQSVLES